MATLVPVDHDPFATPAQGAQPVTPPPRGGSTGPRLVPVDHDPFAGEKPGVLADMAGGLQGGIIRGFVGIPGMPGTLRDLADQGSDWLFRQSVGRAVNAIGSSGADWSAPDKIETPRPSWDVLPRADDMVRAAESVIGPTYRPQTVPGEYAATAGEFLAGGTGKTALQKAGSVLLPAITSETAGQLTKSTDAEPWARLVGGVGGSVVHGAMARPATPQQAVAQTVAGVDPAKLDAAHALMRESVERGTPLRLDEALAQVTGGETRSLSNLARFVENSQAGGDVMGQMMAQRAERNAAAAGQMFDTVGPQAASPSALGQDVQAAARQAIDATPPGQALAQAEWQAGPRVTPEQAGQVIQPELRQVYEGREGMRNALANQDYADARAAPQLPSMPPVRPGQVPIQVDPVPVIRSLDAVIANAKGPAQTALQRVRGMLFRPDGGVETSVEGLQNARTAIGDMVSRATQYGEANTARELLGAQATLDRALQAVPEQAIADRNFAAASRPLEPFEGRGPGAVVATTPTSSPQSPQFTMPPEQVPGALATPSAARDFNQVATPAARQAMEGQLTTQLLDRAGGGRGLDADPVAIRTVVRSNEDVLNQFPAVRDRLMNVATAREGLARIEASPLGKLAQRDAGTKAAMEALFPRNPVAGSAQEVLDTVTALHQRAPAVARQLVRTYLETSFDQATRSLQAGPNQFGGAGFAAAVRGNAEQAASIAAAVQAVGGPDALKGFDRLMDIFTAQGTRQHVGSPTDFNAQMRSELKKGGAIGEAVTVAAGGGVKAPARIQQAFEDWRYGRNTAGIAKILVDPNAIGTLKALAKATPGSAKASVLAFRLAVIGGNASAAPQTRRIAP